MLLHERQPLFRMDRLQTDAFSARDATPIAQTVSMERRPSQEPFYKR